MKKGERVRHYLFGEGVVQQVSMSGVLEVQFKESAHFVSTSGVTSLDAENRARDRRERERQREAIDATRNQIRGSIRKHLEKGEFVEADELYDRKARSFWTANSYQKEKQEYERRAALKRQAGLRSQVEALLDLGKFDDADALYRCDCERWWPPAEYRLARENAQFSERFLASYAASTLADLDSMYRESSPGHLSESDYAWLKLPKLRARLARLGMPLDEEQLLACARPEQHRLVRARAGSGKTRTLAAQAAISIHDEALSPDQVLILAFNKKAAQEIGERVRRAAGVSDFRSARTFHSLAWQLADHAGRQLVFDDSDLAPSQRKQIGFVERILGSVMNPAFRDQLYTFFRRELEQIDQLGSSLPEEDYVAFRRAMVDYTLAGEAVKSKGEKFIADFLFEHGIRYQYERVWSWDKPDQILGTPYRPDFCIVQRGLEIVLEHWAIDPDDADARVPSWWETSTLEYRNQINEKRQFWKNRGVTLLETHAGKLRSGRGEFEVALQTLLEGAGIKCEKLDHAELVKRVSDAPRTVSRMAGLFMQFISRAKKRGWSVEEAARQVREEPDPEPRNRIFHELAIHAYAAYERRLEEESCMDFDDLLASATESVRRSGKNARIRLDGKDSIAIADLRWILIDEFQDFSELYFRLISAILEANPSIRVVAVGDDWQAINGFAGAEMSFFNRFREYFLGAGEASISTNRRSRRKIVSAGNNLMEGRGQPALAHHSEEGQIDTSLIDRIWLPAESPFLQAAETARSEGKKVVNFQLARALCACADYIADSVYVDPDGLRWIPSVLILARTGYAYGESLTDFAKRLQRALNDDPRLQGVANDISVVGSVAGNQGGFARTEVLTAHKSKGKEADTVIVLEGVVGQFPKIHADSQLFGPFGVSTEDVLEDERRLFYVAATRAEWRLLVLTETNLASPYLKALQHGSSADRPPNASEPHASSAVATLFARIEQLNQEVFLKQNISAEAAMVWDLLAARKLGLPKVGHSLGSDLHAELAWPEHSPRIAILTGRDRDQAEQWRGQGWQVHSAASLIG